MAMIQPYGCSIQTYYYGLYFLSSNEAHSRFLKLWREIEGCIREKDGTIFSDKDGSIKKRFDEEYKKFFKKDVTEHKLYE